MGNARGPPAHFVPGLRFQDEIPVQEMILPLVVLDIHEKVRDNADYVVTLEDVRSWEQRHGTIPAGAFVALRTDWSRRWPDQNLMLNPDDQGTFHYPGWSREVLEFLVTERQMTACGHETLDTDPGLAVASGDSSLERYLLNQDRYQIELLRDLDRLPENGAIIVATWPKALKGSGFPARVFAICPPERTLIPMEFIFMLTRDDQTVEDCLNVLAEIEDVPLRHIGFKDVGVSPEVLRELHTGIKARGATSHLEVVSTSREAALQSARMAVELGVDYLLGGTFVEETLEILSGSNVQYLPFPGRPTGHPTKLGGTADEVADQCAAFEKAGAAGVDLLAFRATDAEPLDLVKAAREATSGTLVVAGSISSISQIEALAAAGADAFTIGQAAFTGSVAPRYGSLRSQLLEALHAAGATVKSSAFN